MRRRIRDKMIKAAAKPRPKGGRPTKNQEHYEAKVPRAEAGGKQWLEYGLGRSEPEIKKADGGRRALREAVGEGGIRIREVSLPSQEDNLEAQRYDSVIEGVADGTVYFERKRTARDAIEVRYANLPPDEPDEPGSEDTDGQWDGLKKKPRPPKFK